MGTQRCLQLAKMVRFLLGCLVLVAAVAAQDDKKADANPNTRIFGGLGNLVGGLLGGNRPQGGHHHGGGFNHGGGFDQGGFGQGGFGQGGFGQGGFQGGFQGGVGGFPGVGGGSQGGVGGFPGGIGGGVVGGGGGSASCRRWCRTPQGQAYCCEGANEPISAAVTKQGQCPPVRPSCPPTRFGQPPRTCSSDGGCAGLDKCCFDTCLQHHTCKPPIGFGRK